MVRWQTFLSIFLPSVVESVCTMFFVLIGCSSTITWPQEETGPNLVSISLCFGLSYAFLVNISNCFSNGFINPAITMALVVNKTLSVTKGFCFISAHLVGAVIGAGLLYLIVPYESHGLLGVSHMKSVAPLVGFGVELLTSLVVMLTVLTCTDGGKRALDTSASLVIGAAVTACHLFAYPVSGCGINPARSFGPAVVMNYWTDHWVYWFGPIIGALFASGIYHVAQNFPVTTEDELVITGKEIKNEAKPQGFHLEGLQNPSQADMQTQTPYELKTTV
ncbi:unnamed protein product [Porites lobata]|uniref:Uncharacterized protein n=1 Tax=Porites lobata TaxID=104759 RepID=A0ABN8NSL4_9CNID|nr:unnamed protein product [Porites lobata]